MHVAEQNQTIKRSWYILLWFCHHFPSSDFRWALKLLNTLLVGRWKSFVLPALSGNHLPHNVYGSITDWRVARGDRSYYRLYRHTIVYWHWSQLECGSSRQVDLETSRSSLFCPIDSNNLKSFWQKSLRFGRGELPINNIAAN